MFLQWSCMFLFGMGGILLMNTSSDAKVALWKEWQFSMGSKRAFRLPNKKLANNLLRSISCDTWGPGE